MIHAYLGLVAVRDDYLTINYGKSIAQVFKDVASFFARTIPIFSIFLHVEDTELCQQQGGLPSWAPDWTLKYKTRFATLPSISQNGLGLQDDMVHVKLQNQSSQQTKIHDMNNYAPCILPGIMAVLGNDRGPVKAMLSETGLPDQAFPRRPLGRVETTEKIMNWVLTSKPGVKEALETLVDYHIELTSHYTVSFLQRLKLIPSSSWILEGTYIPEFHSILAPFNTKWARQPHLACMPADMDGSEKFRGIQGVLLRDLPILFIQTLEDILTFFKPGGGPIALLDTGQWVQVPCLTRVGDTICTFWGREETLIPSQSKEKKIPCLKHTLRNIFLILAITLRLGFQIDGGSLSLSLIRIVLNHLTFST